MIEVPTKGKQGLFDAFVNLVDPDEYDGGDPLCCLVGQVDRGLSLRDNIAGDICYRVAKYFGVPEKLVHAIFLDVEVDEYQDNYEAALDLAAHILGVKR